MSNPIDPTQPNPDAQPTEAYATPAAPPLPPLAPADPGAQATQAYPDVQPTQAYDPPVYGTPAPKTPDTRSKTLAWVALGLGIAGFVLVLIAFIPLLWVSLVLALIGGLLLLGGLVLGIIAVANKKYGGKGLGIGAIAVSVVGGLAWIGALTFALIVIGLSAAGEDSGPLPSDPAVVESEAPENTDEPEDSGDVAAGAYDEAAYLTEVRPELVVIMQEIDPSVTEADLSTLFSDESLVATGKGFLIGGDVARDAFVGSLSGSGLFSEEQGTRFFDAIFSAAQQHLVE